MAASAGPLPSLRQDLGDYEMGPVSEFDPEKLERELAEGAAEAQEERARSPFRLGMNTLWILVVMIGSAYRVCSGGGG